MVSAPAVNVHTLAKFLRCHVLGFMRNTTYSKRWVKFGFEPN
jgi:hypothetical protein